MPRAAYLLVPIGITFGIWSEWVVFGPGQPRIWLPDLLTGMTILGSGLVAWARRPMSRVGPLLVVTALCWFAGNLAKPLVAASWPTPLLAAVLAEALLASHRAPFAHALLGYPGGRLTKPVERIAAWIVYGSVFVGSVLQFGALALVVATLVAGAAFATYRQAVGQRRRAKSVAFRGAIAVAVALATGVGLRSALGAGPGAGPALLLYELALGGSCVLLAAGLARRESQVATVADIVVELGEVRSGTLGDALAEVLGDPSLEVGYRLGMGDAYVDASGQLLDLPEPSERRAVTRIQREGQDVAVLVHDPSVLDDPALVDAVASAARLASRHAELQAEIRGQLGELRASRRRLVGAGDAERRRLAQRLSDGALRRLDALGAELGSTGRSVDPALESGQRVAHSQRQIAKAVAELDDLVRGLHPSALREGGLAPAIHGLTEHSPIPIYLSIPAVRFPLEIEAGVYFVCAEGLANAFKHAMASRIRVTVRHADGAVTVELSDDGVGGADLGRGSGLLGLADRIEALGGWLTIESPAGGGTRLVVILPLAGGS